MNLADLLTPERLADPYSVYRQVRAIDPVLHVPGVFGIGAWLVTGHALCS